MGLTDPIKNAVRTLVKENEYDIVIFAWDMDSVSLQSDEVITSWTHFSPLYFKTDYVQLAINHFVKDTGDIWKHISHEIMHCLCYRANRFGVPTLDEMDITKLGQPFYKNDDPFSLFGNYALTSKNLEPFLKTLGNRWQYFTPEEKTGSQGTIADLKPDFVDKMDIGRKESGIPWVITSGYRTPEHNSLIGGSPTSGHLTRDSVDVRARNWVEVGKIVDGARKAGITGITVYRESKHVHLDMKSYRLEVK